MKATICSIVKGSFLRDTVIMVIATAISNFFNYLYQLLMGRLLTPQQYGELFSLLSLFYIFSVVFATVNTSITKFTTSYVVKNDYGKIKSVLVKASKNFAIIGVLVYGVILMLSPVISRFLNIENESYVMILFASIPFGFILPAYQGTLRGLQRFPALGISTTSWALFKLFFGVALVVVGYGVFGGLAGVFLANVAAFLVTFLLLRDLFKYKSSDTIELGDIIKYSGLAFLTLFAYTTMWNIDVIMVKHYLSPIDAGSYSAISVLGKIALFAPGAVGVVVFPKAAEKHESGERHFHLLLKGLALVTLISGVIVLAYALFPGIIIQLVYGKKYIAIAPYLWRYGLAMMFFSMIGLMINYSLSINKTDIAWPVSLALIAEGVALAASRTIPQIITTLVIIGFTTVVLLAVWTWRRR